MPEFQEIWLNNGCVFCCKVPHTASADKEPGVGTAWETYWDLWVISGTNGSDGTSGTSGTTPDSVAYATSAGYSGTALIALSGGSTSGSSGTVAYATSSGESGTAGFAQSAGYAGTALIAITGGATSGTSGTVSFATTSGTALYATSAGNAGTAYYSTSAGQSGTSVLASSANYSGTSYYAKTAGEIVFPDAGKATYDDALASDHTATGFIVSSIAGEAGTFGNLMYLNTDGKWWQARANSSFTMPGMRMIVDATIGSNGTGNMLIDGIVRDDSWAWTTGGILYGNASTKGALTQTAPSTEGDQIQIIGKALNATHIIFRPEAIMTEIALDIEDKGTAGYTISWASLTAIPKTFQYSLGSSGTYGFNAPTSADVGKKFRLVKNGTSNVTLKLIASGLCDLDGAGTGGTISYTGTSRAAMEFECESSTLVQSVGGIGTWTWGE